MIIISLIYYDRKDEVNPLIVASDEQYIHIYIYDNSDGNADSTNACIILFF